MCILPSNLREQICPPPIPSTVWGQILPPPHRLSFGQIFCRHIRNSLGTHKLATIMLQTSKLDFWDVSQSLIIFGGGLSIGILVCLVCSKKEGVGRVQKVGKAKRSKRKTESGSPPPPTPPTPTPPTLMPARHSSRYLGWVFFLCLLVPKPGCWSGRRGHTSSYGGCQTV